jgi:hypothetical protein
MPLVSIPSELQQEDNFFRFRFADSRKIRYGTIIDIKNCVVSSYYARQGKYKDHSWEVYKAKYANRQKTCDYKSTISYYLVCSNQVDASNYEDEDDDEEKS